MVNWLLLAAAAGPASDGESLVRQTIDLLWEQITGLTWFQAVLAISFGVVYLLYGWRIFRVLVVISFGMIGMFAGMKAGEQFGNLVVGGLAGTAIAAFLAVPLMKWCVSILGAAAGGILTSGIWYACQLPEQYIWAGAIIGIVAGGMISFILLKAAVMLFTSLGGSLITVVGVLALLHEYEMTRPEPTRYIEDLIYLHPWFLPTVIIVPTLIGMFIQHKFIQHSSKWDLK
ncbi:MAG TPA: DUF4203 domain-containing protein [Anaerohalosphaeraceae bacterium]|jgi:hypothetical protein|nr:DUF4203 domain-containing protein [Anaerohalosphaeraceae bacterium]HPB92852.1 DUF4203 domain-containing protein [Anaerohalosphaeraceae bacterium]HRT23207.1 DUF4203 domain-containing protein [Anaerohalosphaeraceae bacterium]HRU14898.1 DUF4203 domain-containing protein [Anaerohalosphaeraceae bacterium]